MNSERDLKVLIVASEMSPYIQTGGLADVIGSLPKALSELEEVDVLTVIPKYKAVDSVGHGLRNAPEVPGFYDSSGRLQQMGLKYVQFDDSWRTYFVEYEEHFGRDSIYGYRDDPLRFAFFARAALETAKALGFKPDVIHCNEWQTGLLPTYLKTLYAFEPFFRDTATVFTVHNLAYQGIFSKDLLPAMGISWEEFKPEKLEFWDNISFIKAGLNYSDVINTVSRTYSQEIQTPWFGERLDGVLNDRRDVLFGIVNGLDYELWNPATDSSILENYDVSNTEGKIQNKITLLRENDMLVDSEMPLVGIVSRLTYQKGLDIVADALHDMIHLGMQFILLGTGDEHYQDMFRGLSNTFPSSISAHLNFDKDMARRIYAGSDIFLMPSRFEPCGLGQLIAMRYGAIPIARRTGGLVDTIEEYDPDTGIGTGFFFDDAWHLPLLSTVRRALGVYRNKDKWQKLIHSAMAVRFPWTDSAREYVNLYRKAIEIRRQ